MKSEAGTVKSPVAELWSFVGDGTRRMTVPGGWIYKVERGERIALVFVPFPMGVSPAAGGAD